MGMHSVLIWDRADSDPPAKEAVPRSVIRKIPELLDLAAKTA
jgi:hypothetical protein